MNNPKNILCVINYCIRWTDSEMHRQIHYNQQHGSQVLYILLAIGGIHKQNVDRSFASELGVPVYFIQPDNINDLSKVFNNKSDNVSIYYQNTIELRRTIPLIQQVLTNSTTVSFDDCLALDRSKLKYSPVYSVFNKRAKLCIKQQNEFIWKPAKPIPQKIIRSLLSKVNIKPSMKYPTVAKAIENYKNLVEHKYTQTRNNFGSLFDYDNASSSFMSMFISAGIVSIRQLWDLSSNKVYKDELLWNQYCMLYIEHYGDKVCEAEYGPYDRKVIQNKRISWISSSQGNQLIQKMKQMNTGEPLIDSIMNQLITTGFVPNRLRMVFASWCFQKRLDWRLASSLFESYLIDYFQSSNVFNWQFGYNLTLGRTHIFNLQRQIKLYDPKQHYITKWHPKNNQ